MVSGGRHPGLLYRVPAPFRRPGPRAGQPTSRAARALSAFLHAHRYLDASSDLGDKNNAGIVVFEQIVGYEPGPWPQGVIPTL